MRLGEAHVALSEQGGVVVGWPTVKDHDVGDAVEAGQLCLHRSTHRCAHRDVVEADVVVGAGTFDREPVVVDNTHPLRPGVVDDRSTRTRVQVHHQQHRGAVGDGLLGLGLHRRSITLGIEDQIVIAAKARLCERLLEEPAIIVLPTSRRRRVRKKHSDLAGTRWSSGGHRLLGRSRRSRRLFPLTATGTRDESQREDEYQLSHQSFHISPNGVRPRISRGLERKVGKNRVIRPQHPPGIA